MKNPKNNQGNPVDLDQLSTAELERLLQNDFLASHGQTDPEFVAAAMEVIARRKDKPTPTVDVDAAWETFRARMKQEHEQEEATDEAAPALPPSTTQEPKRTGKRRWLRRTGAVAAIVAVLVCLSLVPVQGTSLVQTFVSWTGDQFSFNSENASSGDQNIFSDLVYQQIEKNISSLTNQPILPTWYPEGSSVIRVEENPMTNGYNYTIIFSLNDNEFLLSVSIYQDEIHMENGSLSTEYEKNAGSVEEYYSNQIPHYLIGNLEQSGAAWRNGFIECSLHGYLSIDDLKKMIDSIYTERI